MGGTRRSTRLVPPLVTAKLTAPATPKHAVVRPRLLHRLGPPARVTMVVAPPGYGKTVLARQWADAAPLPVAWLSVDVLDHRPDTFWRHCVRAIGGVIDTVDGRAGRVLEDHPGDERFLAVLLDQLVRSTTPAALVLDDVGLLADRTVFDALALLVDRAGDRLHLVMTARVDPPLPTARWRGARWVSDVRAGGLRLNDAEALGVAATFTDLGLSSHTVAALNERVQGWPIAFHLALVSTNGRADPERSARDTMAADRHVADFLVGEILDHLPADVRDVALVLSVVEWFDADLASALAGPQAGAAVLELARRRLLTSPADGRAGGATRFHPLLRELLEGELRWRDPQRHAELNHLAAACWLRRGDVDAAYRHLLAGGDTAAANELVVQPALRLVDRGDRAGLADLAASLPRLAGVTDPGLALDLATVWLFAGSRPDAEAWLARADRLPGREAPRVRLRRQATRGLLALTAGDLAEAARAVDAFCRLEPIADASGPIEQRFALVAARLALVQGRRADARAWLDRAPSTSLPAVLADVMVPGLEAWLELEAGRLRRARDLVEPACERAERTTVRPHHGVCDTFVVAARTALAAGDVSRAAARAAMAVDDAERLGFDWNRLLAGAVAAEVRLLAEGPGAARDLVADVRSSLDEPLGRLAAELDVLEARALHRLGRDAEAADLLAPISDHPEARVVRAWMALGTARRGDLDELFEGAEGWPRRLQLEAALVRALSAPPREAAASMITLLEQAASAGWVGPFLGHGPRVDAELLRRPLERLHPDLAGQLRAPRPMVTVAALRDPLTDRERTIVELLPSHLSYGEIGDRLHVSVNTVKSNLKSIYRKLGVTSRSHAVEAARAYGLM